MNPFTNSNFSKSSALMKKVFRKKLFGTKTLVDSADTLNMSNYAMLLFKIGNEKETRVDNGNTEWSALA